MGDDTQHLRVCFKSLDHHHANIVLVIVHEKVRVFHLSPSLL